MIGCYQHYKMGAASKFAGVGKDAEQGLYVPLTYSEAAYKAREEKSLNFQKKNEYYPSLVVLCHAFQVIFQVYPLFRVMVMRLVVLQNFWVARSSFFWLSCFWNSIMICHFFFFPFFPIVRLLLPGRLFLFLHFFVILNRCVPGQ